MKKAMQRALIQYRNPKNYDLVCEALTKAGRTDLIGYDKHCLIRPSYKDRDKYGSPAMGGKGGRKGKAAKAYGSAKEQQRPYKKKTIRNVHKKKG